MPSMVFAVKVSPSLANVAVDKIVANSMSNNLCFIKIKIKRKGGTALLLFRSNGTAKHRTYRKVRTIHALTDVNLHHLFSYVEIGGFFGARTRTKSPSYYVMSRNAELIKKSFLFLVESR